MRAEVLSPLVEPGFQMEVEFHDKEQWGADHDDRDDSIGCELSAEKCGIPDAADHRSQFAPTKDREDHNIDDANLADNIVDMDDDNDNLNDDDVDVDIDDDHRIRRIKAKKAPKEEERKCNKEGLDCAGSWSI